MKGLNVEAWRLSWKPLWTAGSSFQSNNQASVLSPQWLCHEYYFTTLFCGSHKADAVACKVDFLLPCNKTHGTNVNGNVYSNAFIRLLYLNFIDSYRYQNSQYYNDDCKSSVVIFVAVLRWHYLTTRAAFVSMSVSPLSCLNGLELQTYCWSGQVWEINVETL